jgi:hypothetical protein
MKADSGYVMDSTEEATENQNKSQDESQNDTKPTHVQLLLWDDIDDL